MGTAIYIPKRPMLKLWALTGLAMIVFSYLFTLAVAVACIWVPLRLLPFLSEIWAMQGVLAVLAGIALAVSIVWSMIPRRDKFTVKGLRIELSSQPRLRGLIEEVAGALGEPMPDEVYLTLDANAFVTERGGVMGFGSRRILGVGLPFLAAMTVSEFRGIVAHEFGHYYAGDAALAPRMYKTRAAMVRVLQNLGSNENFLTFLSRFAFAQLLHRLVVAGIAGYWKIFLRVTQYIARQQEYRSDELACYVAGKSAVMEGLEKSPALGLAFGHFWGGQMNPVLARGYRAEIGEGFARFLQAPGIAKMAAAVNQQVLQQARTQVYDSHPATKLRRERVEKMERGAEWTRDDSRAIALLENVDELEQQMLSAMDASKTFQKVEWEAIADTVYVPAWKELAARYRFLLEGATVESVPELLPRLPEWAAQIRDEPGTLLSREQRVERAAALVWVAMTLQMMAHGWELHAEPGIWELVRDGQRVWPAAMLAELRTGKITAEAWREWCAKAGLVGVGLAG